MKTHQNFFALFFCAFCLIANVQAQTLSDAIRLTDNEQYAKAKTVFEQLIQKDPTNGDNYFYYGDLLLKMQEESDAYTIFKKGVDVNPTNPLTLVGLGRYYLYTGNNAEGQKQIAQARGLIQAQAGKKGLNMDKPRQAVILLEIAETFMMAQKPDYDGALSLINDAEKLDPNNPDVYLLRGDAMMGKDPSNGSAPIANYKTAASKDPKSCKAFIRIGSVYGSGHNMPAAIGYYRLAIKTDSTFAPAYRMLGEAQLLEQRFDSAASSYAKYLRLNPDCYWRYRYAAALYKNGDYENAIKQGELSLACDSSITVVYRIIGRSYAEMKTPDPAKAITYFNMFFVMQKKYGHPTISPDDYSYRAKALTKMNSDSLAIFDYKKALEVDTTRKDLYFDIGTAFYKMRRYDSAAVYYKKKMDGGGNAPSLTDVNAYARALYMNKDYANADSAFIRMTTIDPNQALGWLWAGKSSAMLDPNNDKWLAVPFYQKYFALAAADTKNLDRNKKDLLSITKYLAGYNFIQKNFACSKALFQYALQLDPADADVKKELDTDKDLKGAQAADINTCIPR